MNKLISIIMLACSLVACGNTNAQSKVDTRNIDGNEYVVPTIDLLIHYLNEGTPAWGSEMKGLGFSCLSDEGGAPIYTKGEAGKTMLTIGKDTAAGLVSFEWFDFGNKKSLADDFFTFIKPYYSGTQNGVGYHTYKDWIIGTSRVETEDILSEHIWIMRNE